MATLGNDPFTCLTEVSLHNRQLSIVVEEGDPENDTPDSNIPGHVPGIVPRKSLVPTQTGPNPPPQNVAVEEYKPTAGSPGSGILWAPVPRVPLMCDPALEPLLNVDYMRLERYNVPFGKPNIRVNHHQQVKTLLTYGFYIKNKRNQLLYKAETQIEYGHASNRRDSIVLKNHSEREVLRFTTPLDDHNYQMRLCPFCCFGWCRCWRERLFCERRVHIELPPGHRVSKLLPAPGITNPEWILHNKKRRKCLRIDARTNNILSYLSGEKVGYCTVNVTPGSLVDTFEATFPKDVDVKVKLNLVAYLFILDHYNLEMGFESHEEVVGRIKNTFNTSEAR